MFFCNYAFMQFCNNVHHVIIYLQLSFTKAYFKGKSETKTNGEAALLPVQLKPVLTETPPTELRL